MSPGALLDARTIFLVHLPLLWMMAILFGALWRQGIGGRQAGLWALGLALVGTNLLLAYARDVVPAFMSAGVGFLCTEIGGVVVTWGIFLEVGRRFPWRSVTAVVVLIEIGQNYFIFAEPDPRPRVILGGVSLGLFALLSLIALWSEKRPYRRSANRFTMFWFFIITVAQFTRGVGAFLATSQEFDGPADKANFSFGLQLGISMIATLGLALGLLWLRMAEWHHAVENEVEERRRSEAALAVAKDNAEVAAQAKSRFLASVSHDIRTPMNAIIGLSRLLTRTKLDERQRTHMTRIGTAANTLLELIEGVLDAARIEAGTMNIELRTFDLADVLLRVDTIARVQAEAKGLTLETVPAADVPMMLLGDPVRLGQILLNIAGNAVKFTDAGEVTLSVAVASRTGNAINLVFTVHDTGSGIAAQELPFIFEPFRRGPNPGEDKSGTGLGLAIAAQLAQLMGGKITVQSILGLGCTFTVELPFTVAAYAMPAVEPSISIRLEAARILVAEDDEINREVAGEILRDAGAIVEMVTTGKMAVDRILSDGRVFDAVLMDVRMPEMDGIAATLKIRTVYSAEALPIIAVTAHAFDDERDSCLAAGMNDFVTKPIEPTRLLQALARCIPARATLASSEKRGAVLPLSIPGFDIAGTLGRFCGNESAVQRLLVTFSQRCIQVPGTLQDALSEGRLEDARTLVHGFRGAAATLGATALSTRAARLEKAIKDADRAVLPVEMAALAQETETAATALRTHGFR